MSEETRPEDLVDFPCDYVFKGMGPNSELFVQQVQSAVNKTVAVSIDGVKVRPSAKGNYVSVSVMVRLHNFEQLKAIYQSLREIEDLKFLL